ncbi:glyceraldehyde 3-phosphate dehydrogenase [Balneicella halophila]|uniref:Glyceraldehyde 3-phosphate dehydrogenase n=1 Tax=Balneicella halophila TaxID=1537566 RepID=A0A7L4UQP6_BALHA|nr:glyceraldehyde-3-phosphate dehydrogenase [Balneicella halophila]PVX52098.1 glyceraldehyde 3-phosphate dehydrogenase [Balneicella halophila]
MMDKDLLQNEIQSQRKKNQAAVEFIKIVNDLWYEDSTELILFRNQLIDKSVAEIHGLIDYSTKFIGKPITIQDVLDMAKTIKELNLPSARLDVGKLTYEYLEQQEKGGEKMADFVKKELRGIHDTPKPTPRDVVLYGFGRIGRLAARILASKVDNQNQLRLRAIVIRGELTPENIHKRASLLRNDSVHGDFRGTVVAVPEQRALIINGMTVYLINANSPDEVDYTEYGINDAIVIDNTGVWRDTTGLSQHLKSKGVAKVILTAPGKDSIPNIVYGVNHLDFSPDDTDIFSAASCTTNAIIPILRVIEDAYGVEKGHIETIHAYTNDQNLVDNYHKKYRRGRGAATNMVITETGAGKAVAKAIPELAGKFTSNAIRVPVPNGSLVILNIKLKKKTDLEHLKDTVKQAALNGKLVEQIKYAVSNELVSSDIVGVSAASIFDSNASIVTEDGEDAILYVWYDNEYGYTQQVIRLAKYIGKVRRFHHY